MPNMSDLFPSRYLKSADLQGREPVVTIARVEVETFRGRTQELKAVLYFEGKQKGLKLNKTLATMVARIACSTQTEAWIGVQVQLYAATADFGSETFDVVRIKAPVGRVAPKPRPVPTPAPVLAATGTDGFLDNELPAVGSVRPAPRVAPRVTSELTDSDIPF